MEYIATLCGWHYLGLGGGYNERDEIIEYKDRDDSDGELDEVCFFSLIPTPIGLPFGGFLFFISSRICVCCLIYFPIICRFSHYLCELQ